jgi:cytochrome c1
MALVQSGVHVGSVITAGAQEDLHRLGDLVEQNPDLRGVIDVAVSRDGSDDPAGHRVKADVQFAPRSPLAGAVFLNQPLAQATQFQAGTIDQQVDRSARRAGLCRQLQRPSPPAE